MIIKLRDFDSSSDESTKNKYIHFRNGLKMFVPIYVEEFKSLSKQELAIKCRQIKKSMDKYSADEVMYGKEKSDYGYFNCLAKAVACFYLIQDGWVEIFDLEFSHD